MSVVSIIVVLFGDYEDFRHLRQRLSRIHFSLDVTPISRDCGGEIQKAMSLAENLCFQLQCPAHALRIIIGLRPVSPSIVTLSAAARAKIGAAAKARWDRERKARAKKQKPKETAKKAPVKAKPAKAKRLQSRRRNLMY